MNLQFPVDAVIYPLQNYDINNPPVVPDINWAPDFMPYLPYLTGVMMQEITNNAVGPVSIHFYNRMVNGNQPWYNNDFVQEVTNCADFIFLKTGNQRVNPGDAIVRLVPAYLGLRTLYEVRLCDALWGYINQNDQGSVQQDHRTFEREMAEIDRFRNTPRTASIPTASPGVGSRIGGYAQPNVDQPRGAPVSSNRSGGAGRDYSNSAPDVRVTTPTPAPVATPTKVAVAVPQGPVEGALVSIDSVTWKPSDEMPYPMAYNPVRVTMMYKIKGGATNPTPINSDINMIDYDRHNIVTLMGTPPANLPVVRDNTELMNELVMGTDDAAEEEKVLNDHNLREEEHMGLRAVITATSFEGALQDVKTEMLAKIDPENRPMVFQAYAHIYQVVVGEKSEYPLIKRLEDSSTFIELREKLAAASGTTNPELISEINLRFTDLMNHILHRTLSILPIEITVDDFMADIDQLLPILKKAFGDKMLKAFLKDQAMRIKSILLAPDVNDEGGRRIHDLMVENQLTGGWDGREDLPEFTYFGSTVRFTMLNVLSHDLQLAGIPKIGNILTKLHTPGLYKLAQTVFKSDNQGMLVARQLVVTLDGRILEFTQTALVEDNYLVTLIK